MEAVSQCQAKTHNAQHRENCAHTDLLYWVVDCVLQRDRRVEHQAEIKEVIHHHLQRPLGQKPSTLLRVLCIFLLPPPT